MNVIDVERVFRDLGSRHIKHKDRGLMVSCPFAPYKPQHKSSEDRHPSMIVFKSNQNRWVCKCYCCATIGDLLELVDLWGDTTGNNVSEIKSFIRSSGNKTIASRIKAVRSKAYDAIPDSFRLGISVYSDGSDNAIDTKSFWQENERNQVVEEIEIKESDIAKYLKNFPAYALNRGLNSFFIKQWELGLAKPLWLQILDRQTNKLIWVNYGERLIIPIRNHKQKLVGWSARATKKNFKGPKYLHAKGTKLSHYLYGEHKLIKENRLGYIVEGFFDVWRLAMFGYQNAMAVMSGNPSNRHLRKMVDWFDEIIVVRDGDKAGLNMALELKERLPIRVKIVDMIDGKDPGDIDNAALMKSLIDNAR